MVAAAGYTPTGKVPALSYVLSLLALKLTSTRRVSRVYDIATDPGAALSAGLTASPKATALTTYSYRLEHARQAGFLTALDTAALAAGLADGEALNPDFTPSSTGANTRCWTSTTCPAAPSAPGQCSPSSPKTPAPTPCSTPTPTCPRLARTGTSSPSPTTGGR
jgi:hypothetical protein